MFTDNGGQLENNSHGNGMVSVLSILPPPSYHGGELNMAISNADRNLAYWILE